MMYRPQFLCPGDSVSIVSPASIINPDYVKGATGVLESWSLGVTVSSHCLDHSGVYSGTIDERMNDFRHALYDPAVKAVLCSRGGYGAVHLLDGLTDDIARNPKWIIGFSDISALHALCVSRGVMSLHAPMCKHLTTEPADNRCTHYLRQILFGEIPEYKENPHPLNRCGEGRGMLVGGNMAVLCGLIFTPYDIFLPGTVLFIEDIGFGIFTAVMAFIFLCTYNDGELRGFFFLGIVIGMILYYQLCSKFLLRAVIHITEKLKKIIRQFEKVCLRPGIHIKRNLKWQLKKEKKQVTMALKKQIKRGGKSDNTKETK